MSINMLPYIFRARKPSKPTLPEELVKEQEELTLTQTRLQNEVPALTQTQQTEQSEKPAQPPA